MNRATSSAAGFMTGARYLNSLRDNREVWLDGARIEDITQHKSFIGVINELARIYDLQSDPELQREMTFSEPATGQKVSVSWMLPRAHEDLRR